MRKVDTGLEVDLIQIADSKVLKKTLPFIRMNESETHFPVHLTLFICIELSCIEFAMGEF